MSKLNCSAESLSQVALEQAPTVAWLATQQHPRNPSQCVVTTKLDRWDHAELIARPTRKDGE